MVQGYRGGAHITPERCRESVPWESPDTGIPLFHYLCRCVFFTRNGERTEKDLLHVRSRRHCCVCGKMDNRSPDVFAF